MTKIDCQNSSNLQNMFKISFYAKPSLPLERQLFNNSTDLFLEDQVRDLTICYVSKIRIGKLQGNSVSICTYLHIQMQEIAALST